MGLSKAEKKRRIEVKRSWDSARPYTMLYQLLKTLDYGASVGYFLNFGGQKETTVRRILKKLLEEKFVRRAPHKFDRRVFHYFLTAKGSRAIWKGKVEFKS